MRPLKMITANLLILALWGSDLIQFKGLFDQSMLPLPLSLRAVRAKRGAVTLVPAGKHKKTERNKSCTCQPWDAQFNVDKNIQSFQLSPTATPLTFSGWRASHPYRLPGRLSLWDRRSWKDNFKTHAHSVVVAKNIRLPVLSIFILRV